MKRMTRRIILPFFLLGLIPGIGRAGSFSYYVAQSVMWRSAPSREEFRAIARLEAT